MHTSIDTVKKSEYNSLTGDCFFVDMQKIVPPVLNSLTDKDSRVRYYACEALYNIAKVSLWN